MPGMALSSAYATVQFTIYDGLKSAANGTMLRGAIAAAVATIIVYPLDVLRTRKVLSPHRSLLRSMTSSNLYGGLGATLLQVVPSMSLIFWTHDRLKGDLGDFGAGAIAGVVGKTAVMPIDVLRRRLQASHVNTILGEHQARMPNASILRLLVELIKREHLRGAFAGWTMAVSKAAPSSALTFAIYGVCKSFNKDDDGGD